jgi:hypothetical protein
MLQVAIVIKVEINENKRTVIIEMQGEVDGDEDATSGSAMGLCPEEQTRMHARLRELMMAKGMAHVLMYQDARVLMRQLFVGHNDAVTCTSELWQARCFEVLALLFIVLSARCRQSG